MDLKTILSPQKSIAIVGLSNNPDRPSYIVAKYLLNNGFTIIPVNPTITHVFSLASYPTISSIPLSIPIDIVDIFRKSEEVPALVKEIITSGRKPIIWMQESVISEEGRQLAQKHGLTVIMDKCIMKVHNTTIDLPQ